MLPGMAKTGSHLSNTCKTAIINLTFFPKEILKLLMAEVVLVQGHANLQN